LLTTISYQKHKDTDQHALSLPKNKFVMRLIILFLIGFVNYLSAQGPQIQNIMVDACTGDEGFNEFIVVRTGSSSFNVLDLLIDFPPGPADFCNTGGGSCGTNTILQNATLVSALNASAGCALFTSAAVIPANARLFIFTGFSPTVQNYSFLCAQAPLYVLFCNNTTATAGRFANNGTGTRALSINFGGGFTDNVTYNRASLFNGDGAMVNFTDAGVASYPTAASCNAIALSVNWGKYSVEAEQNNLLFSWETLSETNNDRFEVIKVDVLTGTEIIVGTIKGALNSATSNQYQLLIENHPSGNHYFKIKQIDTDGRSTETELLIATIQSDDQMIYAVKIEEQKINVSFLKEIEPNSNVRLLNLEGKTIQSFKIETETKQLTFDKPNSGIFIVAIEGTKKEHFKLMNF
jgi:hypothetical protein